MKRTILTGIVAIAAGVSGLIAQQAAQPPAAAQKQAGPNVKSQGEAKAVQALGAAQGQGPDAIIAAAEDLISKYADTEYKEIALSMEASAYEQKGDSTKQQVILERVLELNPKNADAHIKLGDIMVKHTRENDLDKEDKLTRAEKHLNQGMEALKDLPKPNPQVTDEQWDGYKKAARATAQDSLGIAALDRKKYDDAVTHLKAAIEDDPQPAYQAQLASAYQQGGKNDDAIAVCDKLLADPQLHPQIKQYTQGVKTAATKAKGGAGK